MDLVLDSAMGRQVPPPAKLLAGGRVNVAALFLVPSVGLVCELCAFVGLVLSIAHSLKSPL